MSDDETAVPPDLAVSFRAAEQRVAERVVLHPAVSALLATLPRAEMNLETVSLPPVLQVAESGWRAASLLCAGVGPRRVSPAWGLATWTLAPQAFLAVRRLAPSPLEVWQLPAYGGDGFDPLYRRIESVLERGEPQNSSAFADLYQLLLGDEVVDAYVQEAPGCFDAPGSATG